MVRIKEQKQAYKDQYAELQVGGLCWWPGQQGGGQGASFWPPLKLRWGADSCVVHEAALDVLAGAGRCPCLWRLRWGRARLRLASLTVVRAH